SSSLHSFPTRRSSDLRDASSSDREERSPRSALIEIGQERSAVQVHITIPQYRRADGNRCSLLAPHGNHKNGHRHTERERILASRSEEHTSELQSRFDL